MTETTSRFSRSEDSRIRVRSAASISTKRCSMGSTRVCLVSGREWTAEGEAKWRADIALQTSLCDKAGITSVALDRLNFRSAVLRKAVAMWSP